MIHWKRIMCNTEKVTISRCTYGNNESFDNAKSNAENLVNLSNFTEAINMDANFYNSDPNIFHERIICTQAILQALFTYMQIVRDLPNHEKSKSNRELYCKKEL